jgi:hypothetical protein
VAAVAEEAGGDDAAEFAFGGASRVSSLDGSWYKAA